MTSSLQHKRIIVTGAAGGIGTALCFALHKVEARLAITSRSADKLAALASAMDASGDRVYHRVADLAVEADVQQFLTHAKAALSGIDALVTLTGSSPPGPITDASVETFDQMIKANLTATFLACKHALPSIGPGGIIVNVGSLAGQRPNAVAPLYCTAKAAVDMFSRTLALQAKERGVRVTAVNPGGVDTPFWGDRPVDRAKLLAADDVAAAIMFVLTRPPHVVVHDISFESTGSERPIR